MFGLTTTRRLRREALALHAVITQLRSERDQAREERDTFKAAVKTTSRQFNEADDRNRLIEGGHLGRPVPATVTELRERDRARVLEQRLANLQAINERCQCGGLTPHTPRICACGHGARAHTVAAPHPCTAVGSTCLCKEYRQLPHAEALAQLERNRQAAAERERAQEATP
jgi:hypothetical protein